MKVVVKRYGEARGWPPPPDPSLLARLRCRFIQKFLGEVRDSEGKTVQLFEWVEGYPLRNLRGSEGSQQELPRVLRDGARGLCYLHSMGLLHGDVAPSNLVVTEEGRGMWIDVGARLEDQKGSSEDIIFGQLPYLAPEVLARKPLTSKAEVFSFGLLMVSSLLGPLPWATLNKPSEVAKVLFRGDAMALVLKLQEPWNRLTKTLKAMLALNPDDRPTACHVYGRLASFVRSLGKA